MVMAKGTPFEFQIDQQELDKMEKLKVWVFTNTFGFRNYILVYLGIKSETPCEVYGSWHKSQRKKTEA